MLRIPSFPSSRASFFLCTGYMITATVGNPPSASGGHVREQMPGLFRGSLYGGHSKRNISRSLNSGSVLFPPLLGAYWKLTAGCSVRACMCACVHSRPYLPEGHSSDEYLTSGDSPPREPTFSQYFFHPKQFLASCSSPLCPERPVSQHWVTQEPGACGADRSELS